MVLMSRRKMSLKTRMLTATEGASKPSSAPATIATKIHTREGAAAERVNREQHNCSPAHTSRKAMQRCRLVHHAQCDSHGEQSRCQKQHNAFIFVLSIRCEGYQSSTETIRSKRWFGR